MRPPLSTILRRGVVFLYPQFPLLDDPALAGQTKAKFIVILSASPLDDPVLYVLTTSEKATHLTSPLRDDFLRIEGGRCPFFPKDTLVNAGQAGQFEFDRADLEALYDGGALVYQGALDDEEVGWLAKSLRVARRTKQVLQV